MHREISHADHEFAPESNFALYVLTALLGLLIGIDIWPAFAAWLSNQGLSLPSWSREWFGYRVALIAAVLGGARVLYSSLEGLLEGRIGADLALAIACIAAILFNKPLVAAEVVFIGMVGECLESITFARAQRAIRGIVEICPRRCWLLRDGQEVRVLTSELKVGDRVVVKPGARVPVDGPVIEGRSALDRSALTGESLPVDVGPGDAALAGSLNQFGALTIEAQKVAEHTVVGRVIELTARALRDKATVERTADRLARYFLPLVLALAALTFFGGVVLNLSGPTGRRTFLEAARLSIDPTLALLVVACPCALILATPAAIIAALGRLAKTGVLIKGGSSLERLAEVSAMAFDKTGTLTEGRLELGDVIGFNDVSADELIRMAAIAEQRSEHPLARLFLQEARSRNLTIEPVEGFQAHPGAGVSVQLSATAEPAKLIVGTKRLLEEQGVAVSADANAVLEQLDATGQTALFVARMTGSTVQLLGVVGARDRVRPEAAGVLGELRALGIKDLALLTGDRPAAARVVASQLDITEVHAELLPADKAEFLKRWSQESGRKIAMVGDGINDAPALACADVGLAIGGTGTELAAEAGDIVFMGDPLKVLPLLVRLSRETIRIIRQNILIFAFGVNGVGIVLTAWLWPLLLPAGWHEEAPLAAVIYHQFGSLAVLLNSMRLLWFERTNNSAWNRTRELFRSVDAWMARYLDIGEFGHWLGHYWRPVLGASAFLAFVAYLFSGVFMIGPDEVALVRRFGQLRGEDLGPGLHWCWPWPVDEVVRIQPERIHTVEIGFRAKAGSTATSGAWSTAHRDVIQLRPEEAVMITGDGNLVEVQATVRYTIQNPRIYLFDVREPEEIIRATAESVLRETIAGRPFIELLTAERGRFQREAFARLEERYRNYGGNGLGIRIDGLDLPDLHPPQEVVESYHAVAKEMEKRDQMVNEAQADGLRRERKSEETALKSVRAAEADKNEKILVAEANRSSFLAKLQSRTDLSMAQECQLVNDTLLAMVDGQKYEAAVNEYQQRRRSLITAQAILTDFRLFWNSLGDALTGRDKILVDADKVPGRRNLLLFDPEQFRVPVPMMMPTGPPSRSSFRGEETEIDK